MAKSTAKSRKALKQRTALEWILFIILLLLILFLFLASHYSWWPFSSQYGSKNLGTAFYTATAPPADTTSGATSASNGSSGSSGSNGSNGTNGSNGSTTTTPPAATTSPILTFAAGVNTGDTKEQTSGQANGLNEHCALLINSSTAGKQEVCTYTEGDKVVTVTYLDDHVVSASRSGF